MVLTIVFFAAAVALVALGGLFAAIDAALTVLSRNDLTELANGSRAGRAITAIAADPGAYATTANFMRVVAETTAAVLVTLALAQLYDPWWLVLLLAALIMSAVSFVLVGSSPRSVGRAHPLGLIRATALMLRGLRLLLGPIARGLVAIGDRVTPGRARNMQFSSEQQLLSMVDEATELDVLEEDDRELIHSVFEFSETVVREVMVPRTDMVVIEADTRIESAMSRFLSRGVSRMPVVGRDADEVLGVLYLRDVARLSHEKPLDHDALTAADAMRPALFVPESKAADETLRQMQLESNHLALVVDEYGGIAGLVTMEDLIEELVGDIVDEYDRSVPEVEELTPGRYRVSARLSIDELGDLFSLHLEDDDVDTVGGLLTKALGRLPVAGSTASIDGLMLVAERTEGRRRHLVTLLVERDEALIEVPADAEQEEGRQ